MGKWYSPKLVVAMWLLEGAGSPIMHWAAERLALPAWATGPQLPPAWSRRAGGTGVLCVN